MIVTYAGDDDVKNCCFCYTYKLLHHQHCQRVNELSLMLHLYAYPISFSEWREVTMN